MDDSNSEDQDTEKKRLVYRATHRGLREADLILGGFVKYRIATTTCAEREFLARLLQESDAVLLQWLQSSPNNHPEHLNHPLIDEFYAFAQTWADTTED